MLLHGVREKNELKSNLENIIFPEYLTRREIEILNFELGSARPANNSCELQNEKGRLKNKIQLHNYFNMFLNQYDVQLRAKIQIRINV